MYASLIVHLMHACCVRAGTWHLSDTIVVRCKKDSSCFHSLHQWVLSSPTTECALPIVVCVACNDVPTTNHSSGIFLCCHAITWLPLPPSHHLFIWQYRQSFNLGVSIFHASYYNHAYSSTFTGSTINIMNTPLYFLLHRCLNHNFSHHQKVFHIMHVTTTPPPPPLPPLSRVLVY